MIDYSKLKAGDYIKYKLYNGFLDTKEIEGTILEVHKYFLTIQGKYYRETLAKIDCELGRANYPGGKPYRMPEFERAGYMPVIRKRKKLSVINQVYEMLSGGKSADEIYSILSGKGYKYKTIEQAMYMYNLSARVCKV